MSEAVAYRRIREARTGRKLPVLFEMVARAELHLTGIHSLAAHLTEENHLAVLAEAKHMTHATLERLQALHAHQIPDGDPAEIVALAFDALLEKTLKRKAAITERPCEPARQRSSHSRHVPAQVRRAVGLYGTRVRGRRRAFAARSAAAVIRLGIA